MDAEQGFGIQFPHRHHTPAEHGLPYCWRVQLHEGRQHHGDIQRNSQRQRRAVPELPGARDGRGHAYRVVVPVGRALGGSGVWILLRHLLPNAITPAIVLAARDIGGMVVLQATFTFIGLGASSPWGMSLNLGRNWVLGVAGNPFTYWWVFLPVTFALVLFGLSWTLVGDMLNDWADPRQA